MRKRRGRGLGSSPTLHAERAAREAKYAIDDAEHAIQEATAGRCSPALFSFMSAAKRLGGFEAESHGAGHSVAVMNKTSMMVERARTAIREHCLVKR